MARRAKKRPVAFVSYSWDSQAHKNWVCKLAEELVRNDVEVILDQWNLKAGQSVTQFMEVSVKKADYVIAICTPSYAQKSNSRKGGVGYEQQIVSAHMARSLRTKKVIPILRKGTLSTGQDCAMPRHLSGLYTVDLRRGQEDGYEALIRAIVGEKHPLSLGQATRKIRRHRTKTTIVRLPDSELDGFWLRSGVASSEQYPKTFFIPPASRRARLAKGDLVKLLFVYAEDWVPHIDGLHGERMWVKITGTKAPYLIGKLMNEPLGQDKNGWPLAWGDKVHFLPEHVIDIE